MIKFEKFVLQNGLRVLVSEDPHSSMACMNILYDVGARDEQEDKTGFAHLFEHLMFSGSVNIPNYDQPLQRVGGENNAFTSNDITNYYITLPANNLETAFWLESDRMFGLAFNEQGLEVQRNVVIEEFKQRYLNQPYGDVWLKLRELAYQVHPYKWATIGKEIRHIEEAKMEDVKAFFTKFYSPNNAIVAITGNVKLDEVKALAEKWFGDIPKGEDNQRNLPQEPAQSSPRRLDVNAAVPVDSIYMAFHTVDRLHPDYYVADLLTDVLSRGTSSRLYRRLVKDQNLFSEVNAYVLGSLDHNLLIVEGKPHESVSLEEAETALWQQLALLASEPIAEEELIKVKNKAESTMRFAELSILDKAMNLSFYELLGDADLYNQEVDHYAAVTAADIQRYAADTFRKENSSTLIYHAQKKIEHAE